MINKTPNHLELNDYCFCLPREWDYGGKRYKGIDLHYFNIIMKDKAYLMPKKNLEGLYYNNNSENKTL